MSKQVWQTAINELIGVELGACAWDAQVLLDGDTLDFEYISDRGSLIVVRETEDDLSLIAIGEKIRALREQTGKRFDVMLMFDEPDFARRLKDAVLGRMDKLGLESVAILMMCVHDVAGLKAGSLMQSLSELKNDGKAGELGLYAEDARWAEWLAINTGVRAIGTKFDLDNQSAAYRTIGTINDYGMVGFGFSDVSCVEDVAFRLAQNTRCLPVIGELIGGELPEKMTEDATNRIWDQYCDTNVEPEPLPRGLPPN